MLADAHQTHRPARVGLVNLASGRGRGVVRLLLDDLAEAGAVYERLSGVDEPVEFGAEEPADTYVLGFYAEDEVVATLPQLELGTQVYVVVCCESCDADEAWGAVSSLENQCSEAGLLWCGGMVVPGAANLPRVWGKPRMGWARRRVSEVTDELLLAIRCGEPAGVIVVRPRLTWRLP